MDLGQDGGREDNVDTTTKYRLLKIKPFLGGVGGLTDVTLIINSSWLHLMHGSFLTPL